MHKLAILLKTYIKDLGYVEKLVPSFERFNKDNIPMYLVAPDVDLPTFRRFENKNLTVLSEESITPHQVRDTSVFGYSPGYINQQIIKLAFWEMQLCENYFCMDSDGVFIRDFFLADFMYDTQIPYTILVEDNELKVEPEYYNTHWVRREEFIRAIQRAVDLDDSRLLTCHAFAIFSCKVLESLYTKFLVPKGMNYIDLMRVGPFEFSWYNMWLQKDRTIDIQIKEPIFKFFHQKSHHIDYKRKGVTLHDMTRGFIGYNLNSGYSRVEGIHTYENMPNYELSVHEILAYSRLIAYSIGKKFRRKVIGKFISPH